jgi:hypothetical protein
LFGVIKDWIIESVSYFPPTTSLEVRRCPTFSPSLIFYRNVKKYPGEEKSHVINIIPYFFRTTGNSHHFVAPYLSFTAATCFGHRYGHLEAATICID